MTLNEYQRLAMRTSTSKCDLSNAALGLCGESGEVADLIKKHVYQGHDLDKHKLAEELGDVCWYISLACEVAGLELNDVMQGNIDKLMKRYPDGFKTIDSIKRVDVNE